MKAGNKMDIKDTIELLDSYKTKLLDFEKAVEELDCAKKAREDAEQKAFGNLESYDNQYKQAFIEEKIGRCPDEASAWGLLFLPVYIISSSRQNKKIRAWNEQYRETEKEYFTAHKDNRSSAKRKDSVLKTNYLKKLDNAIQSAQQNLEQAQISISEIQITLPEEYKNLSDIEFLISFLLSGRADNLKEAILLLDEQKRFEKQAELEAEHRAKIEQLAKEQADAAKEAADSAARAESLAKEAAENSRNIQSAIDDATNQW